MSTAAASTKSIASGIKHDSKRNTASRVSFKEKSKSNEDEFMAAAIGDEEWLRQSVRHAKEISFDKNVRINFSHFFSHYFHFYAHISFSICSYYKIRIG